jgi:hypothetical protein
MLKRRRITAENQSIRRNEYVPNVGTP